MKTKQPLPPPIRTICKYDLSNYIPYLQTVQAHAQSKARQSDFVKRCERVVRTVQKLSADMDDQTKQVLYLVFLRRDAVSVEAAADLLGIGKTQAYMVINRFLVEYAIAMGYVTRRQMGKKKVS